MPHWGRGVRRETGGEMEEEERITATLEQAEAAAEGAAAAAGTAAACRLANL